MKMQSLIIASAAIAAMGTGFGSVDLTKSSTANTDFKLHGKKRKDKSYGNNVARRGKFKPSKHRRR